MSLFGWSKPSPLDEAMANSSSEEGLVWGEDLDVSELGVDMSQGMFAGWGTQCADCLAEQGLPMGNGSHGICSKHSQQTLSSWRSKGRRAH